MQKKCYSERIVFSIFQYLIKWTTVPPPYRGDHTTTGCNLFVVPPHTEGVVFSVDGALSSNFSLSAKDMRVKPDAVETAR